MLLIGSLGAMWAWWGKQFHEPKCGSGHVCRVMAWTRQQGLVPYIGFEKVREDICVTLISNLLISTTECLIDRLWLLLCDFTSLKNVSPFEIVASGHPVFNFVATRAEMDGNFCFYLTAFFPKTFSLYPVFGYFLSNFSCTIPVEVSCLCTHSVVSRLYTRFVTSCLCPHLVVSCFT